MKNQSASKSFEKHRHPNQILSFATIYLVQSLLILVSLSACRPILESPFSDTDRIKADESFDRNKIHVSGDQILLWHQNNQTGMASALNPGKEKTVTQEVFSELPCRPTEELIELWSWHNGAQEIEAPFIWYHDFLSVENAIAEYQRLRNNRLIGWQENWIPLFVFQDEWYFVECYPGTRKASPVGYYFLEDTVAYYSYESLTKMLETSAAWFEQKAVFWDHEQQGMAEDMGLMLEIHQQLNKGTRFPYYAE